MKPGGVGDKQGTYRAVTHRGLVGRRAGGGNGAGVRTGARQEVRISRVCVGDATWLVTGATNRARLQGGLSNARPPSGDGTLRYADRYLY